jgi:renalase
MAHVAIVGAGLTGLMAARALQCDGLAVTLFDKGRGPGGRAATRRSPPIQFDHGAQFFTIREPRLVDAVAQWQREGVVAPWPARLVELRRGAITERPSSHLRYVGTPSMSALSRHLAHGLELRSATRVQRLDGCDLQLDDGSPVRGFDAVVITAPPAQALALVESSSVLAGPLQAIQVDPCWALMVAFAQPLDLPFDAAFVREGPLAWISREASKPGRPPLEALTVHAGPEWSRAQLEDDASAASAAMLELLVDALGRSLPTPTHCQAHRWRFSQPIPLGVPVLVDPVRRWIVAGDALLGGKVEGALLSGLHAAEAVVQLLG